MTERILSRFMQYLFGGLLLITFISYGERSDRVATEKQDKEGKHLPQTIHSVEASEFLEFAGKISNSVTLVEGDPELNIWVYDADEMNTKRNLILIFQKKQDGHFERINSIGSLIPTSSFSEKTILSSDRLSIRRSPLIGFIGIAMQYLYYSKLREFDSYFAQKTDLMERELFKPASEESDNSYYGLTMHNRTNFRQAENYESAPVERSASKNELPDIPIEIYQYRLLNEQNRPVYATFAESNLTQTFLMNYLYGEANATGTDMDTIVEELNPDESYQLQNVLQRLDLSGQPIGQVGQYSSLTAESDEITGTSVFIIPKVEDSVSQVIYSLLKSKNGSSFRKEKSTNPLKLRGLGRKEFQQPEHFEIEPGQLTASDLIIGYGREQDLESEGVFPFIVSNDRKIPENENIVIHFEVYQLETNREGFSRFEVDYSFRTVSGFFNLFSRKVSESDVTLSFEPNASRFAESLEIKTESLETGSYDLDVAITDLMNGRSIERSIRFEIVENTPPTASSAIE